MGKETIKGAGCHPKACAHPLVWNKTLLLHEGSEAVGNSPSEFGNIIKSEVERWKAVSKAAGIRAE